MSTDPREPVTDAERTEFAELHALAGRVAIFEPFELGGVRQFGVPIDAMGAEAVERYLNLADRILYHDQPLVWAALRTRRPRTGPIAPRTVTVTP